MSGYVLAIDQGATSSRAILFDGRQRVLPPARNANRTGGPIAPARYRSGSPAASAWRPSRW